MWIAFCSICICISLVMSLIFCLCWKKKNPKDEWIGVDGMVTPKNPDENVNNLPSPVSCTDEGPNEDSVDNNKRNTATNTRRSLPDIPSEMDVAINWEPNGDNTSELYATLGQYQTEDNKIKLVSAPKAQPSISEHSSIGQTDDSFSPYERVKYDKIKSKEHPYAQVQPPGNRTFEEIAVNTEERHTLLRTVNVGNGHIDISAPARSRTSSSASASNDRIEVVPTTSSAAPPAAAAGVAVNYDLSYMPTPPVTIQPNFSGDSQDSSKGYTSISVREPLANILAQTKEMNKQKKRLDDVHYSTVSDDSDDVYTTIPDTNANQIYTSESETYSKIAPLPSTAEIEISAPSNENCYIHREEEEIDLLYEPPPPPPILPSVDSLKHVASCSNTHSRQASSSSIANLNSPKPEKRQANSPLPPPPPSSSSQITVHNLDDLYAKVYKNKKDDSVTEDKLSERSFSDSVRSSLILAKALLNEKSSEKMEEQNYYEKLRESAANDYPGYEKIKGGLNSTEPGYASINERDSLASNTSDAGYEVLRNRLPSETNYEELIHHRLSNASDSGYSKIKADNFNGYSVIKDKKKTENQFQVDEPNYESVPSSEIGEPNYAALTNSNYNDTNDPNYECVEQANSKYENVNDFKRPYDQFVDDPSGDISAKSKNNMPSDDSNSSASRTLDESEPSYERLRDDSASDFPDYEKVNELKNEHCSSSSGINGITVIQRNKDSAGSQFNSV